MHGTLQRTGNFGDRSVVATLVRRLVMLGVLVLLVTACGDDGSSAGTQPGESEPWGRTFVTDGPPPVRVTFRDGQVSAQAECNTLGGGAVIEDGLLVVTEMGGTEMGCDAERLAYDEFLAGFLTSSPTITLDGDTLTLVSGDDTLVLVDREVADPDRPLVATEWTVDGIVTGDAVSSVPSGVTATMRFTEFRVEGSSGCNSFSADLTIAAGAIEMGEIVTTDVACADDAMGVEGAVYATLSGSVSYEIDASTLRLTGPGGHGLMLRAADAG
jgi:heat shock protein HslJ